MNLKKERLEFLDLREELFNHGIIIMDILEYLLFKILKLERILLESLLELKEK